MARGGGRRRGDGGLANLVSSYLKKSHVHAQIEAFLQFRYSGFRQTRAVKRLAELDYTIVPCEMILGIHIVFVLA